MHDPMGQVIFRSANLAVWTTFTLLSALAARGLRRKGRGGREVWFWVATGLSGFMAFWWVPSVGEALSHLGG